MCNEFVGYFCGAWDQVEKGESPILTCVSLVYIEEWIILMDVSHPNHVKSLSCLCAFEFCSTVLLFIALIVSGLDPYLITWNIKAVFVVPTIGIRASDMCLGGT